MRLVLLALMALLAQPALAAGLPMANGYGDSDTPRDIDPETLGHMFCTARLTGDMAPVAPYYARKLTTLLAKTPDATAVPWQSVPDRPSGCDIRILNGFTNTIGVLVEVSYTAATARWSDTLNLERTPDSWRLNNVFYQGGGNLRFRLFDAVP